MRSAAQQAALLEWVLSVQFFRDNARSSFMRQEIAKKVTLEEFAEGEVICTQGDAGDAFFILLSGVVVVNVDGEDVVALDEPGTGIGERALEVEDGKRTSTVTAFEDTVMARLEGDDYRECMRQDGIVASTGGSSGRVRRASLAVGKAAADAAAAAVAAEEAVAQAKAEAESKKLRAAEEAERETAEREKAEREKAEREKAEREKAEREKAEREKAERETAERETAEREKAEREKDERETARLAAEEAEAERAAAAQAEAARVEAEKNEAAREKARERAQAKKAAAERRAERERQQREVQQRESQEQAAADSDLVDLDDLDGLLAGIQTEREKLAADSAAVHGTVDLTKRTKWRDTSVVPPPNLDELGLTASSAPPTAKPHSEETPPPATADAATQQIPARVQAGAVYHSGSDSNMDGLGDLDDLEILGQSAVDETVAAPVEGSVETEKAEEANVRLRERAERAQAKKREAARRAAEEGQGPSATAANVPLISSTTDSSSARKVELKAELQAMKPTELRKRAMAAEDITEEAINAALDSDSPKEALVDLCLSQQLKTETSQVDAMRAELQQMKPTELHKRALAAGINADVLDSAIDSDNPKDALVDALLQQLLATAAPAPETASAQPEEVVQGQSAQVIDGQGWSDMGAKKYNLIVSSSLFEGKRKCYLHATSLQSLESAIETELGLGQPIRIFVNVNRGAVSGCAEVTDILDVPYSARIEVHPPEPCELSRVFDECDETGGGRLGPYELEQAAGLLGVDPLYISTGMASVISEMRTDENDEVTKDAFREYWMSADGLSKIPHLVGRGSATEAGGATQKSYESMLVRDQSVSPPRLRTVRSVQASSVAELTARLSELFRLYGRMTIWGPDGQPLRSLDDLGEPAAAVQTPIEIGSVPPVATKSAAVTDKPSEEVDSATELHGSEEGSDDGEHDLADDGFIPPPPPGRPAGKTYTLLVSSLMFTGSRLCTLEAITSLDLLHRRLGEELQLHGPLAVTFEHPTFREKVRLTDLNHLPLETRVEVAPAGIPPGTIGRLRDLWGEIDADSGTGCISKDVVEEMAGHLGVSLNPRELSETMRDMGGGSDVEAAARAGSLHESSIRFPDFCSWWVDPVGGGAGSKRLRKALSSMLQNGRPLRREYSMLVSSVDDSLFPGKRNIKVVAGNKEQLATRVAVKLGVNETLRMYFFDAQYGERQLLSDLEDLPAEARVEVEAVGYVRKPEPATAAPVEVQTTSAPEDTGEQKKYNLLVQCPVLANPKRLKITCGSLERLLHAIRQLLETEKNIAVYFEDPDFGQRVELVDLEDLPQTCRVEVELASIPTFQLSLICPQTDSLRVFDERVLDCELEADSVGQLVAGVMHFLNLQEEIRLLFNEDGGDELTDLSELAPSGDVLCVELITPREVQQELVFEPQPEPEPEPEPEPSPLLLQEVCTPTAIDQRTFDVTAHFTLAWWQTLLARPDLMALPSEVTKLKWYPRMERETCKSEHVVQLLRKANPGPLGNSAKLRDFLLQLGGIEGPSSHSAYILFANQSNCTHRGYSVASTMALVSVHDTWEQRVANSVLLHRESTGSQQVSGRSVVSWFDTIQSISDAVVCLHGSLVSKLCGAEGEPGDQVSTGNRPSSDIGAQRRSAFAEIVRKAVQKSLVFLSNEVRAGLSYIDSIDGKQLSPADSAVAAGDDKSLQMFLESTSNSERLRSWVGALNALWVTLSSDTNKAEMHEENLRVTVPNILKAFSQSPGQLEGWAELSVAYKWIVRLGLGWSISARRMVWLFSSGNQQVRMSDLACGLVLRSEGSMTAKIKAILKLNGVTAGRRWSPKAIEASLRPFVFLAVDVCVTQTTILQSMFALDDGLRDVLLRVIFERARQFANVATQTTVETIEKHPTKSALALAVHAFQHAQVAIWLTNIQRSWLSSLWYCSLTGRETARCALMNLPQPEAAEANVPRSIVRTSAQQVAHAICSGSGQRDFTGNFSGGVVGMRAALVQLLGSTDFDGSAALDTLAASSDPKALPLAACFISKGTRLEKVGASLEVLGIQNERDMAFAVQSWLTAFGCLPPSILGALITHLGGLCGGDDERDHSQVQQQLLGIVNGAALPVAKKMSEQVEQLAYTGSTSSQNFSTGVSQILGTLLDNMAAAWLPLLPQGRGSIGLHASTVGRRVCAEFGKPSFEIGKATATMSTEDAAELAVSLGCTDRLLIARMCWLCDAGSSGGGGAESSACGSGVWCRDFATTLIALGTGHHDDKRHLILQLNGMTSVETSWSKQGSSRQLRRDQLFKAFRPLLLIAMDVGVASLSLNGEMFEFSAALTGLLLRSVKLRSMIFLEDVCTQMSTPTNTVAHSEAKQKLHRWIDWLSASWLQFAVHHFGSAGHGNAAGEPPSWPAYLRPDPVGFTAGASPLTHGFCAPVGMTVKDESDLETVNEGNWG